jgi:class 3 adenylate cyclase
MPDDSAESINDYGAWLEATDGKRLPIQGNLSIGRSPKNSLVLDSPGISRRHAIINVQNVGEFWLIDLGSSNGTFLRKRRVHQPVQLCDLDQVIIGDYVFTFRQPIEITGEDKTTFIERTIREIENVPCWLLVADIENFTPLSRNLPSDKLATLIGGWVAKCTEIIEGREGVIDKYLGDGFLAYWRENVNATKNVADALAPLKQDQSRNEPRFRLALHFGLVAIGGLPSMGEESLMGRDVNFVFRMEKLAGSLGIPLLISSAGKSKLAKLIETIPAGVHELKGFEGKHEFFVC